MIPADDGVYEDCRYYLGRSPVAVFWCQQSLDPRHGCHECEICPKCGAKTYHDADVLDIADGVIKWMVVRVCPTCSMRTRGIEIEGMLKREHDHGEVQHCAVERCGRTAWEGYSYEGKPICAKHRGQLQKWRRMKLVVARHPLLERLGRLIENPLYRIPTRRR